MRLSIRKQLVIWLLFLGLTSMNTAIAQPFAAYKQQFDGRAVALTTWLADYYAFNAPGRNNNDPNVPDAEKYNWPATIARFSKYCPTDSIGNLRINTFKNNNPFHFTFVGMARIMCLYPDAPAMKANKLLYLQKVFNRTDGYNAFTGEGTENHLSMNKTSGYLYAQEALLSYPGQFPQAAARMADMKAWASYYSKQIYATGTGEWNSSTYGVYNIIGWLNLFDFAKDPDVKRYARAVLDYYAFELALHYTNGVTGGAESRGNTMRSTTADTDYLNWLWFGDSPLTVNTTANGFFKGNQAIAAIHAATSSYFPNELTRRMALKKSIGNTFFLNSKPAYWLNNQAEQKQFLYIGKNYTMGCALLNTDGWLGSDYQVCPWKLVSRVDSGANNTALVVTGNGRFYNTKQGKARQPFDQMAQYNNVLIFMTKVPADYAAKISQIQNIVTTWKADWQSGFSQRFPGDNKPNPVNMVGSSAVIAENSAYISWPSIQGTSVSTVGNVTFINLGKTFLAVRPLKQTGFGAPVAEATGRLMVKDSAAYDTICGYVVEAADSADYPATGLAGFKGAIAAVVNPLQHPYPNTFSYKSTQNIILETEYKDYGNYSASLFDWGYGPTTPQTIIKSPAFSGPSFPTFSGSGRVAALTVNGTAINFSGKWAVYGSIKNNIVDTIMVQQGITSDTTYSVNNAGAITFSASEPLQLSITGKPRLNTASAPFYLVNTVGAANGTWTGTGVITNGKRFSPQVAGAGSFTLIYTAPSGTQSEMRVIDVSAGPIATTTFPVGTKICTSTSGAITDSVKIVVPQQAGVTYQWYRNNQPVAGATSNSYSTKIGGVYKAYVQDACNYGYSDSLLITPGLQPNVAAIRKPASDSLFALLDGTYTPSCTIVWRLNNFYYGNTVKVKATAAGTYKVTVTCNGCDNTATIVVPSILGLAPININSAFNIYPNPTSGIVNLKADFDQVGSFTTTLVDAAGKVVYTDKDLKVNGTYNVNQDFSHLPKGIYTLKVQCGSAIGHKMLVLQ